MGQQYPPQISVALKGYLGRFRSPSEGFFEALKAQRIGEELKALRRPDRGAP